MNQMMAKILKRNPMGHHWLWYRLSRLASVRPVSYVLLPTVVISAVGVAAGPTLWRMLYPPVREFCVAQLARLEPSHILWYVLLFLATFSLGALVFALAKESALSARLRRTIACRSMAPPANLRQVQQRHQLRIPLVCTKEEGLYAFCHGLLHPAIVISSGLNKALSETEMEAVLLHEAAHASSRDPLRVLVSKLVTKALFYIPLVNRWQKRYLLRLEVSADRSVVSALGVQPLASALKTMLQAPSNAKALDVAASMMNVTEERILHLQEPHRKLPSLLFSRAEVLTVALIVVGSGLLGGGFTSAVNALIGSGAFCNFQV